MDQEKVGKFIAECRKEKGLTQAQLAEKFGISNRAVSKWETGKSLPDASIMIDLSNTLGITVNELLTGERINIEDYREKAELTIVETQKERENIKRIHKRFLELFFLVFLLVVYFAFKFSIVYQIENLYEAPTYETEKIEFSMNEAQNPILDGGIIFDNKYGFSKELDDPVKTYVSHDKKVKLFLFYSYNKVTLEDEQWQQIINYNNSFARKLLLGKNAFKDYTSKNNITSYGDLVFSTYMDKKSISYGSVFLPLYKYRQEVVRETLKRELVPLTTEAIYYADLEDYLIIINVSNGGKDYLYEAYSKNSQDVFAVKLANETGSLTQQEIIDFFELISFTQ